MKNYKRHYVPVISMLLLIFLMIAWGCSSLKGTSSIEPPAPVGPKPEEGEPSVGYTEELREKDAEESLDVFDSDISTPSSKKDSDEKPAFVPSVTSTGTPSSSGLKAGFADDNKQFNYFLNFLNEYKYVTHFPINITERIVFSVKDVSGKPIPNADIQIYGSGNKPLVKGKSHSDGTYLFFPLAYSSFDEYTATVSFLQEKKSLKVSRTGERNVEILFDSNRPDYSNIPLDILFIMDTTGSMGEEINRLKTTIEIINMNLVNLSSKPDVRFGMVLYKDRGEDEEYITQIIPLTGDLEQFQRELDQVYADGGGDYPEDLQSALEDSLKKIEWSPRGIRLSFIITDAPPHLDYGQPYSYVEAAKEANERGIKIFSVGTGGLNVYGEYILRQISQYTYAKYIFLTYGEKGETTGGAPGSVSHHTGSNWQTDKLESIIIRFAKEELSYLSDQPLDEGEEFFEAKKLVDEQREETLKKLFDMAISQLIDYSSIQIPKGTRAAVIPVIATEKAYNLDAEYFTDQLISSLSTNSVLKMVERKDIQKILEEQQLQLSGLVDDSSAVKIGAVLGAEMLISGKLYIKDNRYEIFLKLLRVETTEILGVTKTKIDRELGLSK